MEFKVLRQELEHSAAMIASLLTGISQEQARVKPAPDSWSVLEVVCHLYDEEREDFREHLDFILHRQEQEWHRIDTVGWVTERKYNEQDFGEMQAKFYAERKKSLAWLDGLADAAWDTAYRLPWGPISAGDMFVSWIAHDNLHVRQLVELRRLRIESMSKPYQVEYAGEW